MTTTLPVQLTIVFLKCVVLLWGVCALKTRLQYGQYDPFFVARCEAQCWLMAEKNSCIKSCLSKPLTKPGQCPKSVPTPFDAVCLETCHKDSECLGLAKCCKHECGVTCQDPDDLSSEIGIPNIPQEVSVREGPKKRIILLEWKSHSLETQRNKTVINIIEERHHTGHNFIEKHLSDWSFCARTTKQNYLLKNLIKPGRWYQFRVAAVNENGTKGFSKTSPTYNIALKPKPPKAPQNVTVTSLWSGYNGTLIGELRWLPPRSDLPIQKYKIFWSRRLHGVKPLDSVLVHQQVVSKDQNKFLIENLEPNSLYFLQIQALVQYGRKRLKGQKSALILNTSNYTKVAQLSTTALPIDKIEDLRVQKMYLFEDDLRVRIAWKTNIGSMKYTVTLWSGHCYKGTKSRKYFNLTAITRAAHFDLYNLQFNCKYRVGVKSLQRVETTNSQDTYVSFVTPDCNYFKAKNMNLHCND